MPRGAHSLAMSAGGDEGPDAAEVGYLRAALAAAQAARDFLAWMEGAAEKLAPGRSEGLAAEARDLLLPAVARARAALDAAPPPDDLAPYASRLAEAFGHAERACALFAGHPEAPPPAPRVPPATPARRPASSTSARAAITAASRSTSRRTTTATPSGRSWSRSTAARETAPTSCGRGSARRRAATTCWSRRAPSGRRGDRARTTASSRSSRGSPRTTGSTAAASF